MTRESLDSLPEQAQQPGVDPKLDWFVRARYGMFIHYGLYSMLGRGEWVMNRERMSPKETEALATRFKPDRFDADALCDLAIAGGMRYINLTTMHHEGFRLYDTRLSSFNAMHYTGRDLVAEVVEAARRRGLRIALYTSLNNWYDQPDAADALESPQAYEQFIANTFERIRELVTLFNPIDVLWYDGWWPFNAERWRAAELDAMVKSIQPQILVNGRHGGAGDFATPEQHMSAPRPWRPWEGCMTLNRHWGYHRGDALWKSPIEVVDLLRMAANGRGNLLLNIGPRGDGSVPERSEEIVRAVGQWLERCGEAVFDTDRFSWDLSTRHGHNGDWSLNGFYTLKGRSLYHLVAYWPGSEVIVAGLEAKVEQVTLLGDAPRTCSFTQRDGKVTITGLPDAPPDPLCTVFRLDCDQAPSINLTAGMRIPRVPHPTYDPAASDIVSGQPG